MTINELWRMSVSALSEGIRKKQFSSTEVIKAHLSRMDQINPSVNAITVKLEERALAMARLADEEVLKNKHLGALHGVPFTIKENVDLAGTATTSGMVAGKEFFSPVDAPHIAQLLNAGAIPVGRTNLSEMSLRPHTDNELHGPTLNPWNRKLTPGGSSGGDSVAVATGMTPLGMGNDYGGSLRVPAQFCGVTSIKPGSGRVPHHSALIPADPMLTLQLFFSNGPIARSVSDLRIALNAICNNDVRDPGWLPGIQSVKRNEPLRIAVVTDPGEADTDPVIRSAVQKAASYLSDAGYIIEEVEPPSITRGLELFIQLIASEMRTMFIPFVGSFMSPKLSKFLQYFCNMSSDDSLASYMTAFSLRTGIAREWNLFFQKYPVILGPCYAGSVPVADFDIISEESFLSFIKKSNLVMMANFLGLPAISLPVGLRNGLPVSVQLISGRFCEDICLDVADVIERYYGRITPVDPVVVKE